MESVFTLLEESNFSPMNIEPKYLYNGVAVPRVTAILSDMLHEDYLMGWANSIGLYKGQKYQDVLERSANIGTEVHSLIEHYFTSNQQYAFVNKPPEVVNAFNSFLEWWSIVSKYDVKILAQEEELVCKYFGGTLDFLVSINGRVYIVDFKTSNHPSYKYFLQLSAYRYMLREKGINVDGIIVLMLDKTMISFKELLLDLSQEEHFKFISDCEQAFMSLVYAYYNRYNVQYQYDNLLEDMNAFSVCKF